MAVGRSGSRDGDKGPSHGQIQDHAATITTAHCLESSEMPVPIDHPMRDILDEVGPMIGMSGRITSTEEGFTEGEKIYSLPDYVKESLINLKWKNDATS